MRKVLLIITIILLTINGYAQTQLWSMASDGGAFLHYGTIFKLNLDGSGFFVVHSCDFPTSVIPEASLIYLPNGKIYGMTNEGGGNPDVGTIFSIDPATNIYSELYIFNDSLGNGYAPFGSLLYSNNGKLYGLTIEGGAGYGVIFSFDISTNTYNTLIELDSNKGIYPDGSLIQASNDSLYGMTEEGGTNGYGVIFSYDIVSNSYTVLHNFDSVSGLDPLGDLLQATDGKLYGMTWEGGLNYGVLFSYDISTNIFTVLHNFDSTTGNVPSGNLIQALNGKLYGLTTDGGIYDKGTLFSFDLSNNIYSKLIDFNGINGWWPEGSLFQASNGLLYGMTVVGGIYDDGVIFNYNPLDSVYTKLRDLDTLDGFNPNKSYFIEVRNATSIPQTTSIPPAISLYPNPNNGTFTLSYHLNQLGIRNYQLEITDITGRTLYSYSIDKMSIVNFQLSIPLSSGIYFWQLLNDGAIIGNGKLMIIGN